MQADLMKLIAYGKVLEDDNKSLKECAIKEGDFLVVMIAKVKHKYILLYLRLNHLQKLKQRIRNKKSQSRQPQVHNRILLKFNNQVNQQAHNSQVQANSQLLKA
jgi:hypothetical protein